MCCASSRPLKRPGVGLRRPVFSVVLRQPSAHPHCSDCTDGRAAQRISCFGRPLGGGITALELCLKEDKVLQGRGGTGSRSVMRRKHRCEVELGPRLTEPTRVTQEPCIAEARLLVTLRGSSANLRSAGSRDNGCADALMRIHIKTRWLSSANQYCGPPCPCCHLIWCDDRCPDVPSLPEEA